jgi:hypothetical protein
VLIWCIYPSLRELSITSHLRVEKYAELSEFATAFELVATAKERCYGPYRNKRNRAFVIIIDEAGNRRTVSYPKYLVEQRLGRVLDKDLETIDHIDGDFNNNDFDNLQILPRSQHSTKDTKRVKLVELVCPMCSRKHSKTPRKIREKSKAGQRADFCGRQCAGRYSREVQLGKRKKLPPLSPPKSIYYKNKDLKATAQSLLLKYASELDVVDRSILESINAPPR